MNLSTIERLRRAWLLFSAVTDARRRELLPYVIKISGAVDGSMLYSRPGSVTTTRYLTRAGAERHAERLARLYPGLRPRVMRRVSSAPLSATLRRHGRVMSW